MKTRKVTRVLLRYVAEITIIFAGITISFLFDQWREENRKEKALVELSKSLLVDVDELKAKLKDDLRGSATWIAQLDSLRIQRGSDRISDRQLRWFYRMATGQIFFMFDPYSPTYIASVSSGVVNDLPEPIKTKLYKLYRIQLPYFQMLYEQQQENITNFRSSAMLPQGAYLYSNDASQITPDLNVLAKEVQRPVYGNFINQVILTEKTVYKMNEEAFETLTALEVSLQEHIARY